MPAVMAVLAIAITTGIFPSSAALAADGIETKRVTQRRQTVLSYWTEERLDSARSADQEIESGSTAPTQLGATTNDTGTPTTYEGTSTESETTTTKRATQREGVPTEGRVFFTASDGYDYSCSGTAVVSDNESTVWTAGHCVHDGGGYDFHTNWIFIPGYDYGDAPYGIFVAEYLQTTYGWANFSSFKYDVGAAVVSENQAGATLTDTVGSEGIAFNQSARQSWTSLGYPAAGSFDGEILWGCDSLTKGRQNPDYLRGPKTIKIDCNMTGGSSGGGWLFVQDGYRYVGSVNSYGIQGRPNLMFGPYLGQAALELYESVQSL